MNLRVSAIKITIRMLFVTVIFSSVALSTLAQRKDVVVMKNGDHFTGNVKRLQDDVLYLDADYVSENIGLDWDQVESIQSTATYQIVRG